LAVAGVDPVLRIQEEDREGEVVIETEQVQIEVVDVAQADQDELGGEAFDLFETDNLPVKAAAVASVEASKHDHDRLAGRLCLLLCCLQVGQPAVLGRHARVRVPAMSGSGAGRQQGAEQDEEYFLDQGMEHA
jgi:hypothetical protein